MHPTVQSLLISEYPSVFFSLIIVLILESEVHSSKCYLQQRHLVVILAFFGFANIYAMRANLSVAIVQMTSDTIVTSVTTVDGQQLVYIHLLLLLFSYPNSYMNLCQELM